MSEIDARAAERDRLSAECFARIEALLIENLRLMLALPDAICEKLGFKAVWAAPRFLVHSK
jgi:hypothetical protein